MYATLIIDTDSSSPELTMFSTAAEAMSYAESSALWMPFSSHLRLYELPPDQATGPRRAVEIGRMESYYGAGTRDSRANRARERGDLALVIPRPAESRLGDRGFLFVGDADRTAVS